VGRVFIDVLVGRPVLRETAPDPVQRPALFVPGFEPLAGALPEIRGQLFLARIEKIGVLDRPVAGIVLGVNADDRSLDTEIDVLRDECDLRLGPLELQRQGVGEDGIVRTVSREGVRQRALASSRWPSVRPGTG